jgi:hypothetical protein
MLPSIVKLVTAKQSYVAPIADLSRSRSGRMEYVFHYDTDNSIHRLFLKKSVIPQIINSMDYYFCNFLQIIPSTD